MRGLEESQGVSADCIAFDTSDNICLENGVFIVGVLKCRYKFLHSKCQQNHAADKIKIIAPFYEVPK